MMRDALPWFLELRALPWLEILKTIAPVATAFIAWKALQNWKRQDKAKRQADFLDQLTEAVHSYVAHLSAPIAIVRIIKIGMDAHVPTWEPGDQTIKGAIDYIGKRGEGDSKRLSESLQAALQSRAHVQALIAKGQVFKFPDYAKCQNAIKRLTWQFGRMEALAAMIGSPSMNWNNTEVANHLQKVIAISADEIVTQVEADNVSMLEFVREAYERLYL